MSKEITMPLLISNNFQHLPSVLFEKVTSFISYEDSVNLSRVNHKFKELTTQSSQKNNSNRLVHLTRILSESGKLSEIEHKEFFSKLNFTSTKLLEIDLNFIDSLIELWKLTKKCMIIKDLFASLSPDLTPDFDQMLDSPLAIRRMVKKYGTRYFSVIKQFFYDVSNEEFNKTNSEMKILIENKLEKTVVSANDLTKNRISSNLNKNDVCKLHAIIVNFYVKKENLSGVVRALKATPKDFRCSSMNHLNKVITCALQKNDNKTVLEILNFYKIADLDLCNDDLSIMRHQLNQVLTNNKPRPEIAKVIKLIQLFIKRNCSPQFWKDSWYKYCNIENSKRLK